MDVNEDLTEAPEVLRRRHGFVAEVEDRRVRLVEPVKVDPGQAVLRALGAVEGAAPVGAAAHGASAVAAGVWCDPELYLARWTGPRRWVVGYRLAAGSRPSHYVRTEGRIPGHLETGNWHGAVPDAVAGAFAAVGLAVDDPPFPVPAPARPPEPAPRPAKRAARRAPAAPKPAPPPRKAAPAPPARKKAEPPRVCPTCRMQKGASQFVEGSEECVDCR